jgi:ABC-type phosphate transport system substrate-binding protein
MNLVRTSVALGVALALGTSAAQAFPRTDYAASTKVYFGGATATDNVLEATFIAADGDGICDSTFPIDIWRSTNQRVITCVVTNENPVTAGRGFPARADGGLKIAFHKESAGGSSNGVNPLIAVAKGQAHSLRWLDVGSLANDCTVTNVPATASRLAYIDHASCTLVTTPSDTAGSSTFDVHGGISDNEPALAFPAPGKDATKLLSKAGVQILFGVPVTTALYRALQLAQFPTPALNDCINDNDPAANVDTRDSEACVPSLEKNQLTALYTQNISDWSDFKSTTGVALTAVPGVTAPTDSSVRICRRVATSGTQASFEALLTGQRCASGALQGFAVPDDSSTVLDTTYSPNQFALGSLVNAAPSSGNVRTCMKSANTGNFWAIGVHSTELTDAQYGLATASVPAGGEGLRFIGINGAAPNLANVANGTYDFFSENTVNYIKAGQTGALAAADARLKIVELVTNRLGNIDAINTINADYDGRPWGAAGILALPAAGSPGTAPYSAAELAASPVGTQTRGANTCNPPFMVKPQPAKNR